MLATVLPVAVFMLILYRLWSVYDIVQNSLYNLVTTTKTNKGGFELCLTKLYS